MSTPAPEITLTSVIPAYLEEKNIASTLASIKQFFAGKPYSVEYLVVDDGSTDATLRAAQAAGARVIRFDRNRGKGAAVRAGMLEGAGEYLLFTDADYPYDISAVDACLEKLTGGADVVIGSRNLPGSDRGRERVKRRIISKLGNLVARVLILPGITDTQAGFKCFRKAAAREIFSRGLVDGWGFDIETLYLARMLRYRIAEVPIRLIPRAIKPSRIQSPSRTALNVLGSIFRVHWNRLTGRYGRGSKGSR
jgi:dolichyl-phosphate beta-glucosyltransferase